MADPKIKYDIEAAVKGEPDAEKLARALQDVSDVLEGDLKKSAQDSAIALEALASKQRALSAFGELKVEVQGLSTNLDKQVGTVDRLGSEVEQAAVKVQTLSAAERSSRDAVEQARVELQSKRDALKSVRDETTGAARSEQSYRDAVNGLKESISQSKVEVKAREGALRDAARATTTAVNAEAALKEEYKLAISSAAKLSSELRAKNTALDQSREALRAAGMGTSNLAQQEKNLQQAVAQVQQEVKAIVPAYQQAAAASSQSTQVQAQNQRTLRDGMTSISTQLARIQQIATVALGGSYAGGLAKSLAETADGVKNLEARIKLATGEGANFQRGWAGVTKVALETNSALDETGTLFVRLAKASEEGGMKAEQAQQRAINLTRTINQSIQLSGSSSEASQAAITQLIQGLQSGVLRGEEFNSVMEQAPRLAQALANGLGVTTGELRKMAEQGVLTSATVMKALEGQSAKVAEEFNKLPPTVGRALQNLSTQWSLYVGEADKGLISSANAAKVIDALAKNLDTVVTTLTTAGKLWAAMQIARLASDFAGWATNTLTATKAIEANTAATVTNTTAQRSNAAAQTANAAAQAASTAATSANTAARSANAKAWGDIAVFANAATAAQSASTVAMGSATAVVASKTTALGLLGQGIGAVTRLLGGPVGLIVTGVMFREEIGKGIATVRDWAFSFTEAGARMKAAEQALKEQEMAQKRQAEAAREAAEAQRLLNERMAEARNRAADLSKEAVGLIAKFDKMRTDGDSAAEAIGKIGKDFDLTTVPGIRTASAVLDKLVADAKISAGEFNAAWAQALDGKDLAQFEVMARAAFKQAGQEAEQLSLKIKDAIAKGASQEVIDGLQQRLAGALAVAGRETERVGTLMDQVLRAAVKRTGLDFDNLQGKISAAARTAINDLDSVIAGLDRLKAQGINTAQVLNASISKAIDTADGQKSIDEVKVRIEQLRKVLGDKVTDGLLEQAAEKAKLLKQSTEDAMGGIQSLEEAMRKLGVTSDQAFKDTAAKSKTAFDEMVSSGKASAREMSDGFKRAAEDAIAANNGIAPSWVKAQASARGYKVEVDAAGKSTLESMKAAEKATNAVGDAARGAAGGYDQMAQSAEAAAEAAAKAAERQADEDAKKSGYTNKDNMGHYSRSAGGLDWTGVWNDLKGRGVDDETARKIASEFFGPNGESIYMSNPGQKKYRGNSMSDALGKAAAEYFRTGQDKIVKAEQEKKAAEDVKKNSGQTSPPILSSGGGSSGNGGIDRVVNIYVGASTRTYPIPTNNVGEMSLRDIAKAVLQLIEQDGRAAGVL